MTFYQKKERQICIIYDKTSHVIGLFKTHETFVIFQGIGMISRNFQLPAWHIVYPAIPTKNTHCRWPRGGGVFRTEICQQYRIFLAIFPILFLLTLTSLLTYYIMVILNDFRLIRSQILKLPRPIYLYC